MAYGRIVNIEYQSEEDYEIATEGTYFNEMANVIPVRNYMSLNELGKGYKGKRWKNGSR